MSFLLETNNLIKRYGRLEAVSNVDFQISEGQIVGLIGPNGAGKTTFLRMLATLLEPTFGKVILKGFDVFKNLKKARRYIGYLPDFFNFYDDLTLNETFHFYGAAYGFPEAEVKKRAIESLEEVDLIHKKDDRVKNLSRGMIQRLGMGVMIMISPEILLLDEPASGLDPKARYDLKKTLLKMKSIGKTIIISSHILSELSEFCSHLAVMSAGKIELQGSVDEIYSRFNRENITEVKVIGDTSKVGELISQNLSWSIQAEENGVFTVAGIKGEGERALLNERLVRSGLQVVKLVEKKVVLEKVFLRLAEELKMEIKNESHF